MDSVKLNIDSHNKSLLSKPPDRNVINCNCRNKSACPVPGKCLTHGVIYQATVTTPNTAETYVGLTETPFKHRWRNHNTSFNDKKYKNSTELSKFIWSLKENNIPFTITWKFLKRAKPYSNLTKRCDLCLWEKVFIICMPNYGTLNKRSEFISTCRHSKRYLLSP